MSAYNDEQLYRLAKTQESILVELRRIAAALEATSAPHEAREFTPGDSVVYVDGTGELQTRIPCTVVRWDNESNIWVLAVREPHLWLGQTTVLAHLSNIERDV